MTADKKEIRVKIAEAYRSGALDELSNLYRDILDHEKSTWTKQELKKLINKRAKQLK